MRAARLVFAVTAAAAVALAGAVLAQSPATHPFTARVVAVTDGDTVRVLTAGHREIRIRLAEIDAPESGQPYGRAAKRAMSDIAFGRTVVVSPRGEDRYGRTVARLSVGGTDASAQMVRMGAAWVFTRFSTDRSLPALQARAQRARLGLWALPPDQRVPPWTWRSGVRTQAHALLPAFPRLPLPFGARSAPTAGPSCSAKRFCSQMSSCEEAVYHLRVCGQTRLDGDHDGKPCERLCG